MKVVARPQAVTPGGFNAKGAITSSGGAFLDSFDSSDPLYSTSGLYVASKRKANALALTDSGASGAVTMSGGGKVYGSGTTGPNGTVNLSGGAAVGDIAWNASNSGVEAGHSADNANVQFNDVTAPFTYGSGTTPSSGTYSYGGTNYSYLLGSGNYNMSSLSLSGGNAMAVTGNTTLYVNGSVNLSGSAFIYIAPGATLALYLNGSASVSGGGVVNGTQSASQCTIRGMPGCTSLSYSGSASLIATVYAPEATFNFSGGAGAVLAPSPPAA